MRNCNLRELKGSKGPKESDRPQGFQRFCFDCYLLRCYRLPIFSYSSRLLSLHGMLLIDYFHHLLTFLLDFTHRVVELIPSLTDCLHVAMRQGHGISCVKNSLGTHLG